MLSGRWSHRRMHGCRMKPAIFGWLRWRIAFLAQEPRLSWRRSLILDTARGLLMVATVYITLPGIRRLRSERPCIIERSSLGMLTSLQVSLTCGYGWGISINHCTTFVHQSITTYTTTHPDRKITLRLKPLPGSFAWAGHGVCIIAVFVMKAGSALQHFALRR